MHCTFSPQHIPRYPPVQSTAEFSYPTMKANSSDMVTTHAASIHRCLQNQTLKNPNKSEQLTNVMFLALVASQFKRAASVCLSAMSLSCSGTRNISVLVMSILVSAGHDATDDEGIIFPSAGEDGVTHTI